MYVTVCAEQYLIGDSDSCFYMKSNFQYMLNMDWEQESYTIIEGHESLNRAMF